MLTSFDASVDRPLGRSAGILFRVEMLSQVLLRSIGVVFLSSVALKIVDPLFHQKASLSFGFLVGLLLVSSFRDRPILIAEIIPGHAIRDGFLDGQVRLWNAGGETRKTSAINCILGVIIMVVRTLQSPTRAFAASTTQSIRLFWELYQRSLGKKQLDHFQIEAMHASTQCG